MVELLERRSFVGRGPELARLIAILRTAEGGSGRVVIVGGEAGVGKSRLIGRFAAAAGATARITEGACLASADEGLPYAPFVEILRDLIRGVPVELLPALLGPGRAELTRLLPELAARAADLPATSEIDGAAQARLFELVLGVFERLARERPLVLVIEDLQWADRATRDLLAFLARTLRDDPVLILLTTRTDDAGIDVEQRAFLAELEREDNIERIDLRTFDRDEVAEQVGALLDDLPDPVVIDRLLERTDGNPFYVEELLLASGVIDTTGALELPPVLRDVLAARIASLSPAARDVLRAAAIAGRRIDDELLGAAIRVSARPLATALREAVESGILIRVPGELGSVSAFRHALLREVVEAELFPGERAALHQAFAEALEARAAGGDHLVSAAEIARHWDGARQPAKALRPTVQAAMEAERVFAYPEALRLWKLARTLLGVVTDGESLAGTDLADVLGRAAECAVLAGEYAEAVQLGRAAVAAVDPATDPARAGSFQNRLRWFLWESGDRRGAAEAVQEALRLLPVEPPSGQRARALAQYAGILLYAGDFERAASTAREAAELATRLDARGERALALGIQGWSLAALGDVDAGLETFRAGQRIAEELGSTEGSTEGIALAATNLAALLDRVGRSEESFDAACSGYELTERLGLARTYGGMLLGYRAKAELVLGRWDDAERSTSLGLRRGTTDLATLWLQLNRARLLVGRGRFREAEVLLDRARTIEERLGGTEFRNALLAAEAELAVAEGRVGDARRVGEEGLALVHPGGPPDPSLAWLAALVLRAEADHRAERRDGRHRADEPPGPRSEAWLEQIIGAVRAAQSDRSIVGDAGGPRAHALLLLVLAEEERVHGRSEASSWAAIAGDWTLAGRPFQTAYARYREAEATLAARGSRDAVAAALQEAHAIALRLEAEPLRVAVERLARQARMSLSVAPDAVHPGPEDQYDFTPRETEVLRLVAEGRTNQQIADALFITRKTASVHVSNILGKLQVANRAEATAVAHRLGLVPDNRLAANTARPV